MITSDYINEQEAASFLKLPIDIFRKLVSAGLIGQSSPGWYRAADVANKLHQSDFVMFALRLKRETAAKREAALSNPDETEQQKSIAASQHACRSAKRAPRQGFEGRRGR